MHFRGVIVKTFVDKQIDTSDTVEVGASPEAVVSVT
jgi:hypothetical protein